MTNYQINPYDLEEIGRAGGGRITAKIYGYWSSDPITVYITRQGYGANTGWNVTMSHSSGGRDTKEVASDMAAAINFAGAMHELAIRGRDLISTYTDTLESFYQQEREVIKAEIEAEKAALAAKVESDPAMGVEGATVIIERMVQGGLPVVSFYRRGSERAVTVSVSRRKNTKFYVGGQVTAKKAVIQTLAELSTRNVYAS